MAPKAKNLHRIEVKVRSGEAPDDEIGGRSHRSSVKVISGIILFHNDAYRCPVILGTGPPAPNSSKKYGPRIKRRGKRTHSGTFSECSGTCKRTFKAILDQLPNEQETAVRIDVESRNHVEAILHKLKLVWIETEEVSHDFLAVERIRSSASATRLTLVLACTLDALSSSTRSETFSIASAETGFLPLPERTFNDPVLFKFGVYY
ncbi:hypothetical protein TNCV_1254791 [Trichonephila clavipes]|nr:hypothetical protein TNCV_1254791 [Trichonephila clavipes]